MIPAPPGSKYKQRMSYPVRGLQSDRQRLVAMAGRPWGLGLTSKLDLCFGGRGLAGWKGPVGAVWGGTWEEKLAGSGLACEHYRILQRQCGVWVRWQAAGWRHGAGAEVKNVAVKKKGSLTTSWDYCRCGII